MKTKFFTLVFFICSLSFLVGNTSFAQSAWYANVLNNIGGNNLQRIQFVNNLTGYACGGHGTLIKTTNGGYTWTPIATGSSVFLTCMYFINGNTGWVAGVEPFVRKTTNGGATWTATPIDIINTYEAFCMQFVNDQTGYISSLRRFHKTTDAGATWNTINEQGFLNLGNFQFINEYIGFAIDGTQLRRTYNSGINWYDAPINYIGGADYKCAYFFNEMTGWLAGSFQMRKTTDGGVTVGPIIPTEIEFPYALKFMNENTGWLAGKHNYHTGMICTTSDAINWINRVLENNTAYFCIDYIDANKVFIGGNSRITSSINTSTSVSPISNEIPDRFSLKQNYPNPFNPVTKINFNLKSSSFTSLKIYDSMGKEVESLVNENLSTGSYSVDFNASKLTSGIYFYTLTAGEFKETRKMMLVK